MDGGETPCIIPAIWHTQSRPARSMTVMTIFASLWTSHDQRLHEYEYTFSYAKTPFDQPDRDFGLNAAFDVQNLLHVQCDATSAPVKLKLRHGHRTALPQMASNILRSRRSKLNQMPVRSPFEALIPQHSHRVWIGQMSHAPDMHVSGSQIDAVYSGS